MPKTYFERKLIAILKKHNLKLHHHQLVDLLDVWDNKKIREAMNRHERVTMSAFIDSGLLTLGLINDQTLERFKNASKNITHR